jgi:hypothetical protein
MFQIPIASQPAVSDRVPVLRDIVSVEISPAGAEPYGACADITVQGFISGKTIDFGSGYGSQLSYSDIANATIVFTVVSEGFDSSGNLGTITRTVYGTSIVRQPYPNNASSQDVTTTIRIALSEFIYNDDKNGGAGTSGVDPRVTIKFGAIKNEAGSDEISNPVTNFKCINSSGLDYAPCIAKWDRVAGVCTADRVTSDFTMACRAYHRFGIACVRFDTSGQTSGNIVTSYSTTRTKTQRTGSGLYAEAYHSASTSMTGNTQGELIDLRFRAYPMVGDLDSVRDSNNHTTANEERCGYNKAWVTCDKNNSLDVFAVVDPIGGNNTTGAVSSVLATAESTPYLNITYAIEDGAKIIYLLDGTHVAVSHSFTRRTTNEWVIVTHHPTLSSKSGSIVQVGTTKAYRTQRLQYKNITFDLASSSSWFDGEATGNYLRLTGVNFDEDAVGLPTTGIGYRTATTYLENCTGDMGEQEWNWTAFSADTYYAFDGCDFGTPVTPGNSNNLAAWELTASKFVAPMRFVAVHPQTTPDHLEMSFNSIMNSSSSANNVVDVGNQATISPLIGFVMIGNIIEKTATTSAAVQIAADNGVSNCHNIIVWHNTVVGERMNMGYNSSGSTSLSRHNWSLKYNSLTEFNVKTDVFAPANANRIGNWPILYGVGFTTNNYSQENFPGDYDGLDTIIGTPGYVADNSYTGTGTGNGNYAPDTSSALKGRIPTGQRVITCDLYGNNIVENGDIGAIQVTV